jgi:hypothetical protein
MRVELAYVDAADEHVVQSKASTIGRLAGKTHLSRNTASGGQYVPSLFFLSWKLTAVLMPTDASMAAIRVVGTCRRVLQACEEITSVLSTDQQDNLQRGTLNNR